MNPKTAIAPVSFFLAGKVTPKARPHFNLGQAYLPQTYREWKDDAILELRCQMRSYAAFPLSKASVELLLTGKHRGDLDNLAGSILDALVQSGAIEDDSLKCVSRLLVSHDPTTKQTGTQIILCAPKEERRD